MYPEYSALDYWPVEWYEGVCEIAVKSPLLKVKEHLRAELLHTNPISNEKVSAVGCRMLAKVSNVLSG